MFDPRTSLRALWTHRHFVRAAVEGEFRGRFARSSFGALWHFVQPLAQAAIFTLVLSNVLAPRLPGGGGGTDYAVGLLAGLAAWSLFNEIVGRCTTVFIEYAAPLKKISFPRLCLPVIVVCGAFVNHGALLLAVLLACLFTGHPPAVTWLALPVITAMLTLLGLGVGLLLGSLNVFARDVGHGTAIGLQLLFWLTPVVYPLEALPDWVRRVVECNPLTPLVRSYQHMLLQGTFPAGRDLLMPLVTGLVLAAAAGTVFRRAAPEIVDAL